MIPTHKYCKRKRKKNINNLTKLPNVKIECISVPPKEEQSVSEDWLIEGERKEENKQGTTEKEWTFLSLNIVRVSYLITNSHRVNGLSIRCVGWLDFLSL